MRRFGPALSVLLALSAQPALGQSAIDENSPLCRENRHSQALLIGNSKYIDTFAVPYAHNDAQAIRAFLINRLCYRAGNIRILKDATFNTLRRWLGTSSNPEGRLWKRTRKGQSNVFVFYSGHGVPDGPTKQAYLLPVDTHPDDPTFGYSLDQLDRNLKALNRHIGPRRTVTLLLDACFSGRSEGGALQSHSGSFRPRLPENTDIIRFTAAGGGQLAFWHKQKKLGLFTSVFLDGANGAADKSEAGNRDGRVTGRELTAFVAEQVAYRARELHGKDQTPTVPDGAHLGWEILLEQPKPKSDTSPGAVNAQTIAEEYKLTATINTIEAWEAFLSHHGGKKKNLYVDLARAALNKLKGGKKIAALPKGDDSVAPAGASEPKKTKSEQPLPDGSKVVLNVGHSDSVIDVIHSPNGQLIATAGFDATIKLWSASEGRLLRTLTGHTAAVRAIAFSPDGKRLASGSDDKTVKLWDAGSGTLLQSLKGHSIDIYTLAFSPNGRQITSVDYELTTIVWNTTSGNQHHKNKWSDDDGIAAIAISSNSEHVLSADYVGGRSILNTKTNKQILKITNKELFVSAAAISPDGNKFAIGSDKQVSIRNSVSGRLIQEFATGKIMVSALGFSPDGSRLAVGFEETRIDLHDAISGKIIRTFETKEFWVSKISISPDGRKLVAGGAQGRIKIWDIESGKLLKSVIGNAGIKKVAYSPEKDQFISVSADESVRLWDAKTGRLLRNFNRPAGRVTDAKISRFGNRVLTANTDNTLKIWDVDSGELVRKIKTPSAFLRTVAYSRIGDRIASGHRDTIHIWNANTGALVRTIKAIGGDVTSVGFSPDGKRLVSNGKRNTVHIWDVKTGSVIHNLEGHTKSVNAVAFLYRENHIVSGSTDGTLRVWYADAGNVVHKLTGSGKPVRSIGLSRYPDLIFSIDGDSIRIWSPKSGKVLATIKNEGSEVLSIAVSRFERQFVSGGIDGVIRVWDVNSGKQTLTIHPIGETGAFFRYPDGKWTATPDVIKKHMHLVKGDRILDIPADRHPSYAGPYDKLTIAGSE